MRLCLGDGCVALTQEGLAMCAGAAFRLVGAVDVKAGVWRAIRGTLGNDCWACGGAQ